VDSLPGEAGGTGYSTDAAMAQKLGFDCGPQAALSLVQGRPENLVLGLELLRDGQASRLTSGMRHIARAIYRRVQR